MEKQPPKNVILDTRQTFFSRLAANVRISVNMIRTVTYVGMMGMSQDPKGLYTDFALLVSIFVVQEILTWGFMNISGELIAICINITREETSNVNAFMFKFFVRSVIYGLTQGFDVYAKGRFAIKMRRALNSIFQSLYFERLRLISPENPPLIDNCDQRLTEDIRAISDHFAPIFCTLILQPFVIVYYLFYAFNLVAWSPLVILGNFVMACIFLRLTMNPMLKQNARLEKVEADFRFSHLMAKRQAESIAITDGTLVHKLEAERNFSNVLDVQKRLLPLKSVSSCLQYFFNYTNTFFAYGIVILAIQKRNIPVTNTGRSAISNLVGGSAYILLEVYSRLGKIYSLTGTVPKRSAQALRLIELAHRLESDDPGIHEMQEVKIVNSVPAATIPAGVSQRRASTAGHDAVSVLFDNVDLYSPNEHLLVYGFSVRIWPGQNTIIHGPSGSGKSSLIRCLAGIWPCRHGSASVIMPPEHISRAPVMYAPQMPVVISGSIVDQLYYPKVAPNLKDCSPEVAAQELEAIRLCLQAVGFISIFEDRLSGNLDHALTGAEWQMLMSPGELQRLVIARLFLHRPIFAVLDEATNAIESTREQEIYELLWAAGVTTISVSHRVGFVKDSASISVLLDGQGNHQVEQMKP